MRPSYRFLHITNSNLRKATSAVCRQESHHTAKTAQFSRRSALTGTSRANESLRLGAIPSRSCVHIDQSS
ncbi:hypothetical protein BDV12DRAFT_171654 [Aspergillus spectabilis]